MRNMRRSVFAGIMVALLISQTVFANECWLDIYEHKNFEGSHTRLNGPVDFPNLRYVNGKDWGDQIDSLIVGPKAQVWAYEDENYEDTEIVFVSNQRIANLDELNFGDEIDSLKIRCK